MVEYSANNRFPFFTRRSKAVTIHFDDYEDTYELDFVYGKIVERLPALRAENFYGMIQKIQEMNDDEDSVISMKLVCDKLLKNIRELISDEQFIHQLHDKYGFGIDKVIETLYAVYGYYFYTGKRTANAIKKIIDGYSTRPDR